MTAHQFLSYVRSPDHTVADRLSALADQVDGAVVALYARHAAAVADGDAQALDVVSVEFEASGLLLSAADSAAQAVPLHARSEGRTKSVQSASRALRLATQCGGAATPAIRYAAQPLPLSSREREIGSLVASGLTSREIAEQLTVSVRTVEGHVYRACIKLGVADRDEPGKIIRRDLRFELVGTSAGRLIRTATTAIHTVAALTRTRRDRSSINTEVQSPPAMYVTS